MPHRFLIIILLAASALAQTKASSMESTKTRTETNPSPAAHERFMRLSDEFMKAGLAISPVTASAAGYHEHRDPRSGKTIALDAELDDLSPAGFGRQRKFYQDWRERFRKETPRTALGPQDQADWDLIDSQSSLGLLELDRIQNYKHNPTVYVELIGNSMFLPLSQNYAAPEVRLGHVLSRIEAIPKALAQAQQTLLDSDPIFIKVAAEENDGNIDLIDNTVREQIPAGSPLLERYQKAAPAAVAALRSFAQWLQSDLAKRKTARTWRLGKEFYAARFKYVMQTPVTSEQILADAERDMKAVRAEMLEISLPMHEQMYPDHSDHSDVQGGERQNLIISEVLNKISDEHPKRDALMETVKADIESIKQFIREKKIVALSDRDNLKIMPTPMFMRGIYSVAGFNSAPPLAPTSEAQYWVTPIAPSVPEAQAESKLREYNNYTLKWLTIHEALPGHYIQFEHANSIQPETRRVLRNLFGNGAYVEGWAEYIAQVMMDEGFTNHDPRFRLVMRKLRLRLLANTILDVRMQTMGMTDEQAMDLMTKDAFQTEAEARGKLQRAKLSSAQLPTYYVGLRDWLALRRKYQERMGPKFNMMEFHNLVLDQGALPLALLEKIVMPTAVSEAAGR